MISSSQNRVRQFYGDNSKVIGNVLTTLLLVFGGWIFYTITHTIPDRNIGDIYRFFVRENSILLITVTGSLFLLYLIPGNTGRSLRWLWIIIIFAVYLQGEWLIRRTGFFQLYGIQPWVDATEYYANTQRLLMGFASQGTTNARPLFSAFFSILLWISTLDMVEALTMMVFLVAVAYYLFGESLKGFLGPITAAITIGTTFMFYRNYLGAITSESLGLILGMGGWVVLFWGASHKSLVRFCIGIFLVTFALIARAGPFIVLPAVVIAGIYLFRNRQIFLKYILATTASIVAGFGINSLLLNIYSEGKSVAFTSYIYSLYGMAAGGKSWGYIKTAHPDVFFGMVEPARTQKIIDLTWELIKSNPWDLIRSMLSQYYFFVAKLNTSVFSYLFARIDWYNTVILIVLYTLSILSIIILIKNHRSSTSLLLLAVFVGVLLSVPLVPPQDESDMRPYAVVVPILNIIPAIALEWVFNRLKWIKKAVSLPVMGTLHGSKPLIGSSLPALFSGIILFSLLVIPVFLHKFPITKTSATIDCPTGSSPFVWYHLPNNATHILAELDWNGKNWLTIRQADRLKHDLLYKGILLFDEFDREVVFSQSVNYLDNRSAWLVGDADIYKPGKGFYGGCGTYVDDPSWWGFNYFRLESSRFLGQK